MISSPKIQFNLPISVSTSFNMKNRLQGKINIGNLFTTALT